MKRYLQIFTILFVASVLCFNSIPAKAALNINPLSYGAMGDDVTDDGPAFQRAIDALPAGGNLILSSPSKKYAIATEIIITKPIFVTGNGWNTVLRANSNLITSVFQIRSGGDGTSFSNFRLEGSKSGTAGTIQRGIYFNGAKFGLVKNVLFSGPVSGTGLNFGVDINGVNSGSTKIESNKFERLVSSTGNGSAILIEASSNNQILNNIIDSSEFNNANGAAGSAIFLSAQIGGNGSTDNIIANNIIHDHPQVGIDINSTTYYEFSGNLGACDRNIIANNEIYNSKSPNGGDASSGIVIVGNSSFNRILNNKIHDNGSSAGGFGILISGSAKGLALAGQPKMDESPNSNEVRGNQVYNNQDDGIRIKGAKNNIIDNNEVFNNGKRIQSNFRNIYITSIGGSTDGSNNIISNNNLRSSQLAYQIGIGSGVPRSKISHNYYEGGSYGTLEDLGSNTINEGSVSQSNLISIVSFNIPTLVGQPIISSTPTPTPTPLKGDLNNDGIVNSLDWSIMNNKWFSNDTTADLNNDGIVNSLDFSIMNGNWSKTN